MSENKIPRGQPAFAESQREAILDLLREAGADVVSHADLIFNHHYSQCGTRVFELQKIGYVIRSEMRDGDRHVTYVLESEPGSPNKPGNLSESDYAKREREERDRAMPLFAGLLK